MKKAITISREFGSGGREVGLKVARALNIPFYDKELIALVAEKGELAIETLEQYEETVVRAGNYLPRPALYAFYTQPITDRIFLEQFHVIQELTQRGSCVIVGRCSDYALKDKAVNVFVHADMATRIRRKLALDIGVPEKDMERHIRSIDKKRQEYYRHHTDKVWGMAQNFNLFNNLCCDNRITIRINSNFGIVNFTIPIFALLTNITISIQNLIFAIFDNIISI